MEGSLAVDVSTGDINFIFLKESDDILDITFGYGEEEYVVADLFYVPNH